MGEDSKEKEGDVTVDVKEAPPDTEDASEPKLNVHNIEDNMQKQIDIVINREMPNKINDRNNMSNYIQNIKNSTSGMTLSELNGKEETLLTESKTVARFSPLWKQVIVIFIVMRLGLAHFRFN